MQHFFARQFLTSRFAILGVLKSGFWTAEAAEVRINRIFATELRAAPHFDIGLRRRNNEFNELLRGEEGRGLPLKGAHI